MAGGAADCSYWIRALSLRMRLLELNEGVPSTSTVAAHVLSSMLRGRPELSLGTMIMGFANDGKPRYKAPSFSIRLKLS
jgi:20S proteasome subunit beta 5